MLGVTASEAALVLSAIAIVVSGISIWLSVVQFRRSGPLLIVEARGQRYRTDNDDWLDTIETTIRNIGRSPITIEGWGIDHEPSVSAQYRPGPFDTSRLEHQTLEGGGPSVRHQVMVLRKQPEVVTSCRVYVVTSDGKRHYAPNPIVLPLDGSPWVGNVRVPEQ